MPATPAWPPASTPRLYVNLPLVEQGQIALSGNQAHYLISVLRAKAGDPVRLFDGKTGEWLGVVAHVGKRDMVVDVTAKLAERERVPDLWLLTAPIKKGRIDWIYEKACELGVARIVPILTHRTVVDKINPDRLRSHLIEAAEQCGRTALPELAGLTKLGTLLRTWPEDRVLVFADETGGIPMPEAVASGPAAILIGPEGGFTDEERVMIRALPAARGVSLGPRVLRADTAAVTAISLWMALAGDWGSDTPVG